MESSKEKLTGKKCKRCGIYYELEQFSANKSSKDGRRSICKSCTTFKGIYDRANESQSQLFGNTIDAISSDCPLMSKCECIGITSEFETMLKRHSDGEVKSFMLSKDHGYQKAINFVNNITSDDY